MKLCLASSHGGHLTQLLMLNSAFQGHDLFYVTSPCPRTEELAARERVYLLQDIGVSPWRMALAFFQALGILLKERPEVVISAGSSVAIPFSWVGKTLGAKVVFIETCSRTRTRTGTGPLVYPVADLFLVQWPALLDLYGPKARYIGGII